MEAIIIQIMTWVRIPILWLSSGANRRRLRGARVEIVVLLLTRKPEPSILLARSVYEERWMPPQEGVNFRESLRSALARCLMEECQIAIENEGGALKRDFYLRDIQYLGMLDLPPSRWGERAVAGNVEDSIFSQIKMKRKAYWTAALIVPSQGSVSFVPNPNELAELRWLPLETARHWMKSNRPEKAMLLDRALDRGTQHLLGVQHKASLFNWAKS